MKIKVITSYKPNSWNRYAKRSIDSVLANWPADIDLRIYHESQPQDIFKNDRIEWIDLHEAQPELVAFKGRHKNDPVANGELQEVPGGKKRPGSGPGAVGKGSFQWHAVRFANKVYCITHAIKTIKDYDYIIWLDADTYTFRSIPKEFLESLCPTDTMLTYLGRENKDYKEANKEPETGFVSYNLKHPEIQNWANDYQTLYTSDNIFKVPGGWVDTHTFWYLVKIYQKEKNITVNDIGHLKKVKGHHVFINSELGLYIDHFKGKRKQVGTSNKNDLKPGPNGLPTDVWNVDYWKGRPVS